MNDRQSAVLEKMLMYDTRNFSDPALRGYKWKAELAFYSTPTGLSYLASFEPYMGKYDWLFKNKHKFPSESHFWHQKKRLDIRTYPSSEYMLDKYGEGRLVQASKTMGRRRGSWMKRAYEFGCKTTIVCGWQILDFFEAQAKDGTGYCVYCGHCQSPFTAQNGKHNTILWFDHKHPLSRQGDNSLDNLVIACRQCNTRKSTYLLKDYDHPERGWIKTS